MSSHLFDPPRHAIFSVAIDLKTHRQNRECRQRIAVALDPERAPSAVHDLLVELTKALFDSKPVFRQIADSYASMAFKSPRPRTAPKSLQRGAKPGQRSPYSTGAVAGQTCEDALR